MGLIRPGYHYWNKADISLLAATHQWVHFLLLPGHEVSLVVLIERFLLLNELLLLLLSIDLLRVS